MKINSFDERGTYTDSSLVDSDFEEVTSAAVRKASEVELSEENSGKRPTYVLSLFEIIVPTSKSLIGLV